LRRRPMHGDAYLDMKSASLPSRRID